MKHNFLYEVSSEIWDSPQLAKTMTQVGKITNCSRQYLYTQLADGKGIVRVKGIYYEIKLIKE